MTLAPLFDGLNPEQAQAVEHTDGPLLILAGAGSGKTRVLTHRAAHLIAAGKAPAEEILCVTFTNKACREMAGRIAQLLGPQGRGVWVRTFHSFGLQLIRAGVLDVPVDPSAVVYDPTEQRQLIREVLNAMEIDPEQHTPRTIAGKIERFKRQGQLPSDVADTAFVGRERLPVGEIYQRYQSLLQQNRALDFGDLLLYPVWALKRDPEALDRIQRRFRYVMVDEFQDTNQIQYELLKLVAGGHRNLAVVGDDDQAIYGWRGADIMNILGFEQDFQDARVVKLERNYRSTKVILDAAWEVVRRNAQRKEKRLWTDLEGGDPIRTAALGDEHEEARWLVEQVERELNLGTPHDEVAIFYRTNAQSRVLEEVFRFKGVPYKIVGNTAFYDRREIKDVLGYLKLLHNPNDWIAFQRVVNTPRRGIGKTTVERVLDRGRREELHVDAAIRAALGDEVTGKPAKQLERFADLIAAFRHKAANLGIAELTVELLEAIGYREAVEAEGDEVARDRLENLEELLTAMQEFEEKAPEPTLGRYLDDVSLVQDAPGTEEEEEQAKVQLMTFHSAKGLEFDVVFMAGMEEGILPHTRSLDEDGLEEERRLVYVGMTRARQRLFLVRARTRRTFGARLSQAPCRFLDEVPEAATEDVSPEPAPGRFPFAAPRLGGENPYRGRGGGAERGGGRSKGGVRRIDPRTVARDPGSVAPPPKRKAAARKELDVPKEYRPGARISHPKFGVGVVQDVDAGSHGLKLKIQFKTGLKTILPKYVELTPVSS